MPEQAEQTALPTVRVNMRNVFFGDTAKGGYIRERRDDKLGITETVSAKTGRGIPTITLCMDGDDRAFHSIAEFAAAYWGRYPERLQARLEEIEAKKAEVSDVL